MDRTTDDQVRIFSLPIINNQIGAPQSLSTSSGVMIRKLFEIMKKSKKKRSNEINFE